ncbi:MAG: PEP-CTERM sorting domain-containing protein [Acidobacteria bacterium]|nr:PEP-CTERM sorting domain-containing protein [Acidobacteriota bacterium]
MAPASRLPPFRRGTRAPTRIFPTGTLLPVVSLDINTPEPSTWTLIGFGLALCAARLRRR